jgi:hypothetical protein
MRILHAYSDRNVAVMIEVEIVPSAQMPTDLTVESFLSRICLSLAQSTSGDVDEVNLNGAAPTRLSQYIRVRALDWDCDIELVRWSRWRIVR